MLTTDHIETAQKFLEDADREFASGDILQASEKLWGAASHVVIAEMKRRGMETKTHRSMVQAVEKFAQEAEDRSLRDMFGVARAFHSNFYNGMMEDYEFVLDRPTVHRFVDRMLEQTSGEDADV